MKEPAEEMVFFGEYVAVKRTGYDDILNADSTITKSTYKWMILAHKNPEENREIDCDIYNND